MKILINIRDLLISPRFISFYWRTGTLAVVAFVNLVSENLTGVGLPLWAVPVVSMGLSEITKALNNLAQNKAMGFAPKQ
jgi:hypothetical protein